MGPVCGNVCRCRSVRWLIPGDRLAGLSSSSFLRPTHYQHVTLRRTNCRFRFNKTANGCQASCLQQCEARGDESQKTSCIVMGRSVAPCLTRPMKAAERERERWVVLTESSFKGAEQTDGSQQSMMVLHTLSRTPSLLERSAASPSSSTMSPASGRRFRGVAWSQDLVDGVPGVVSPVPTKGGERSAPPENKTLNKKQQPERQRALRTAKVRAKLVLLHMRMHQRRSTE